MQGGLEEQQQEETEGGVTHLSQQGNFESRSAGRLASAICRFQLSHVPLA